MHTRRRGKAAENLVKQHYIDAGFQCIKENFTIPGGEIDLIVENAGRIVCIEVKDVTSMDSLHDYITPTKKRRLLKTLQTYLWQYPTQKEVRLDIVFVRSGSIVSVIENCEDFI